MNSCISEMPGPEVAVKARAPFHDAPMTMPIEASSSSPCTMAYFALPVSASCRSFLQWLAKASASEDDGGTAIDRAERGGAVAFDENAVADLIGLLHAQADRAFEILQRPVAAEMQRVDVGREQLFLALVLPADQLLDQLGVHVEQGAQRAEIDDVLEQLALARVGIGRVGDRGQRHP